MKLRIVIQVVCFFLAAKCLGQECGVTTQDQESWSKRYERNLLQRNSVNHRTLAEIPITFHLVGRQNGVGRAAIKEALSLLCQLNQDFKGALITFYLSENGINLVNDDGIFTAPQLAINKLAMQKIRNPNSINVFVANKINDGGAIGIYDEAEDWVLIHKSAFLSGNKTLAHEIGHFFSLYHPHFGWESTPWTTANDGTKVGVMASDGKTLTENMDRINCYLAGDQLCDTPPDYNFGLNWQKSCVFGGMALDANGTRVIPDESLIMSYFNDSCRSTFTQEQISLMRTDLTADNRQFLFGGATPPNLSLGKETEIRDPEGMTSYFSKDSISFSWDPVVNANFYYLEVDRSANFNLDPKGILVRENNIKFSQNWIEGINYYARVFSWNEHNTCLSPSPVQVFQINSVTSNTDWNLAKKFNFHYLSGLILVDYKDVTHGSYFFQLYNLKGDLV
ncbi:MAG TPA: hypothetical protein PLY70_18865, partial [Saprospiraceae bacterium]|nr:hypothetical protein [Saprospiraceae bacterium]